MKRFFFICWFILNGPWSAPTFAQASVSLTDIWETTALHHPLLQAALKEQDAARSDLLSNQGAFDLSWKSRATAVPLSYYPQIRLDTALEQPTPWWGTTFFTGWRLGSGNFADYDGKAQTNSLGELRVGLRIPLWRNGPIDRQRANLARQEITVILAQWNIIQQKLDLYRQSSRTYWDWVAAAERYSVYEKLLDLAQRRDQDLQTSVQLGQIPAIERLENQRAIYQRQAQLLSAERQVQQTAIELSLFWRNQHGHPTMPQTPATWPELPKIFPPPSIKDRPLIWQQRPEWQRLHLQSQQLDIETHLTRNQLEPAIDFSMGLAQDFGSGSTTRNPLEVEATLNVDIPLQTRTNQGRLNSLQQQQQRQKQQIQFSEERIMTELQDIYSQVSNHYARLDIIRQELEWAKQIEKAERDRFLLGDSSLLILNLREQATADAAIREIDAKADCFKALALQAIATGTPEKWWQKAVNSQ